MEKYTEENAKKHLASASKEEFLLPYSLPTLI